MSAARQNIPYQHTKTNQWQNSHYFATQIVIKITHVTTFKRIVSIIPMNREGHGEGEGGESSYE
jgi:hypothetical protein